MRASRTWMGVVGRRRPRTRTGGAVGEIDLYAHPHDLLASLGKEGPLLALEVAARGTGSELGEIVGRRRWEHGHEIMACRGCGVLSGVVIIGVREIDV